MFWGAFQQYLVAHEFLKFENIFLPILMFIIHASILIPRRYSRRFLNAPIHTTDLRGDEFALCRAKNISVDYNKY